MKRLAIVAIATAALLAASATSALAAPAQRFPIPDESFVEINACTGMPHTINLMNQMLVIHDDVDPMGGHHITGTVTGNVSTSDGFAGRFTIWFGTNHDNTSHTGLNEETFTLNATMRDGSGRLLLISGVFHITEKDGVVKSFVDRFAESCRGKPA